MPAGRELERGAAERQGIDAGMGIETAVFKRQQQFQIAGIDARSTGAAMAESLVGAIQRAQNVFARKDHLDSMRRSAMKRPSGWRHAVPSYLGVYQRALGRIAPA